MSQIYRIAILFLTFISLPLPCMASNNPIENRVPGGIAKIPFTLPSSYPPVVYYNHQRVLVLPSDTQDNWIALIGIPLHAKPSGQQTIIIKNPQGANIEKDFTIQDKQYKTQHITIKNKRKVNPLKHDLQVIRKQRAIINRIFAGFTHISDIDTRFTWPVKGKISSPFGLKRFYNEQPKDPHTGLDIASPKGTKVKAPAKGKVVYVGNFFYTGKTVFVDHGQGLITLYAHLNKILVKHGEKVHRGDILGTVGSTGRATGPHLHWGVILNGARVDPKLFLTTIPKKPRQSHQTQKPTKFSLFEPSSWKQIHLFS